MTLLKQPASLLLHSLIALCMMTGNYEGAVLLQHALNRLGG